MDNKVTWIEASDSKCRDQGNFTIHTNIYSVWIIKLRGLRQVTVSAAIKVSLLFTLISIQCVWIIKLRGLRQVTVNVAIKVTLLSTLISIQCG